MAGDDRERIPNKLPDMLRHIIRARKLGSAIIPVVKGGKAPAIQGGHKAASKDLKKLAAFFRANPRLNYGIATGAASGFFALDIDGPKGKAALAEFARKHGPLPATVKQLTPNDGAHIFFKSPGYPIPNSVGRLGPGIDIRGDGGYVVGPGSRTSDGMYRFAAGCGPEDVEIAPAPSWLLKLVGRKSPPHGLESAPSAKLLGDERVRARAYAKSAFQSECERLRKPA